MKEAKKNMGMIKTFCAVAKLLGEVSQFVHANDWFHLLSCAKKDWTVRWINRLTIRAFYITAPELFGLHSICKALLGSHWSTFYATRPIWTFKGSWIALV